MAPKSSNTEPSPTLPEDDVTDTLGLLPIAPEHGQAPEKRPLQIVWKNVILMSVLHVSAVAACFMIPQAKWYTLIWTVFLYQLNALGITAGAHRLWSHRSYKARLPLRIFLAVLNSMSFQNDVIEWARDHRVHHKYSETDADPHNAKRGFFFSHVGWLLVRKHPEVKNKGKQLDISDLLADPVLRIQRKFYLPSVALFCFILPTIVPWYFWGESLMTSYFICAIFRYCIGLNATWLVNSAAHLWGWRPYDVGINPSENYIVTLFALGEGFHNYHHTFPQDYATTEFGWLLNLSTFFIDACACLGLAYDRKAIPKHFVNSRRCKTGDRSELARKIK
ncbi:stearoyl-CoA desaturase 5-like [Dreissena polymorpha]|uniref:Fatty acid desaturase domain-containing protein n=1 Tax=Dreissena polymorpha TaxID=45954 RepID=A0A9D4RCJ5_DREPO|nr:stearoyl-CoA desaturase 5-like [Dreissena polymorpha]XP_052262986.1 stearoyl-CoA desaturase 5-like [Dreissena polymorpha]XP_052262987.1 stearoyl-CoA desaturase 5-like [Dreissena polymorpha]XP_052262988.1 stearoyl-CoA desaturase 5-like [Dreissena polymorpha]XP_052262989.1 stearoyl-CoA desaturase 5-like [Dreissena polymorpha]KAH3863249.1 hypothetical protein DPMN_026229 [Dreissena polymorpha]